MTLSTRIKKKKDKMKVYLFKKKLTAASSLWQKRSLKLMINWYHSWAICYIDIFLTDYRQKVIHKHLNSNNLFFSFFRNTGNHFLVQRWERLRAE